MALPSSWEGGQSAVLTASRGEAMPHNQARLGNPMFEQKNMDEVSLDTPAIANAQTPLEKLVIAGYQPGQSPVHGRGAGR